MNKILCVIPCGSKKIWDKIPNAMNVEARHVYIGSFHNKCKEYAEHFYPDSWCILSAKYGFLFPDDIVPESYNITFNDPFTNPINTTDLIIQKIGKHLNVYDNIVSLGGKNYTDIIKKVFHDKEVIAPLSNCKGMGYMMQFMSEQLEQCSTTHP